jgi:tetratricopeptide (TPR) repeat protein
MNYKMTKQIILTVFVSFLAATLGFTSCSQNKNAQTNSAESLNIDSTTILLPDTTASRIAMADTSWETAIKSFPENTETIQDSSKAKTNNTAVKPKISPISRIDPYRPQELKDGLQKAKDGDLRGAIVDFDLCIKKNYKNYNAYFYKAKALIELNEPQNALPNLNLAIENNPRNALFFYYRGKLYFDAGNTKEAFPDFDKAVMLKPDFVDALNYRGVTKAVTGKHTEALEDYKSALNINPEYATAHYNKGTSEASLELYSDAIASFTKAIELDSKKTMSYMNRGNCYVMIKDYKSAINDYSTVIAIDPKNSDAYYNRGAAYQFAEDKNACNDWRKAQSLGNKRAGEMLEKYCK